MVKAVKSPAKNSIDELRANFESYGLELIEDGYIQWNKRCPAHPRNWTLWRKTYNTGVIFFLELITYLRPLLSCLQTGTSTNYLTFRTMNGIAGVRHNWTWKSVLMAKIGKTSVANQAQNNYKISQSLSTFAFTST